MAKKAGAREVKSARTKKQKAQGLSRSYCQMSWPETESGGVFLEGSVDELFSLDDQGDLVVASESSPFL